MTPKFVFGDDNPAFSLVEESGFFRLSMTESEIEAHHVEDFLDTTVEWLSTNPSKGILIDFSGVKSVCTDFVVHVHRYYEQIKERGLYVRFVNVDPTIKDYIDVSNITVVLSAPMLEKPSVSARQVLKDLAGNLSDDELMKRHGLSQKGLESMFRKLVKKGLINQEALDMRRDFRKTPQIQVPNEDDSGGPKPVVDASAIMRDIRNNVSDMDLMRKYRLTRKGLLSLLNKLVNAGLLSRKTLEERSRHRPDH
jgi:anti-anti-sigma regulatory factor